MKLTSKWTNQVIDLPNQEDWNFYYNKHKDETVILFGEIVLTTLSGEADEETCAEVVADGWFLEETSKPKNESDTDDSEEVFPEPKRWTHSTLRFWADPDSGFASDLCHIVGNLEEILACDVVDAVENADDIYDIKTINGSEAEAYGSEIALYDINLFETITPKELGSNKDWDQYFYQKGLVNTTVANAKMIVDGKEYLFCIDCEGKQRAFVHLSKGGLLPLHEREDNHTLLNENPDILLEAKEMEEKYPGIEFLRFGDSCWLNIYVTDCESGAEIGNYYDTFGSVFGSIKECLDAICLADIASMNSID